MLDVDRRLRVGDVRRHDDGVRRHLDVVDRDAVPDDGAAVEDVLIETDVGGDEQRRVDDAPVEVDDHAGRRVQRQWRRVHVVHVERLSGDWRQLHDREAGRVRVNVDQHRSPHHDVPRHLGRRPLPRRRRGNR